MENYEQKYKEALERAKQKRNEYIRLDNDNFVPQDIEFIFPELKESEDERIRKAILSTIKSQGFISDEETLQQCVAWLEKQGLEKHLSEPIDEQSDNCDTYTNDKGCVTCENGELYEGKPTDCTKSNEEQAKKIAVKWKAKGLPYNAIYDSCLEMAEWKDEQFKQDLDNAFKSADHVQYTNGYNDAVEKACEILAPTAIFHKHVISLDNFRKAMQEKRQ